MKNFFKASILAVLAAGFMSSVGFASNEGRTISRGGGIDIGDVFDHGGRGGNRGGRDCTVEMQTRRGRVIDVFRAQNCRRAMRRCERALDRRQDNGRNSYATCERTRGGNRGRTVTRSCEASMFTRRGHQIDTFFAQATGRRGSGVVQQACRKAIRQCERNLDRRQRNGRNPYAYCERSY